MCEGTVRGTETNVNNTAALRASSRLCTFIQQGTERQCNPPRTPDPVRGPPIADVPSLPSNIAGVT